MAATTAPPSKLSLSENWKFSEVTSFAKYIELWLSAEVNHFSRFSLSLSLSFLAPAYHIHSHTHSLLFFSSSPPSLLLLLFFFLLDWNLYSMPSSPRATKLLITDVNCCVTSYRCSTSNNRSPADASRRHARRCETNLKLSRSVGEEEEKGGGGVADAATAATISSSSSTSTSKSSRVDVVFTRRQACTLSCSIASLHSLFPLTGGSEARFDAAEEEAKHLKIIRPAVADIIYDKGAKLQGKTFSTRNPSASFPQGEDGGSEKESDNDGIQAQFVVPDRWRCAGLMERDADLGAETSRFTWPAFEDPVTSKQILERVSILSLDAPKGKEGVLEKVYQTGTIEAIVGSLPANSLSKLEKADIFRANTRKSEDGITYYDWELVRLNPFPLLLLSPTSSFHCF